MKLDAGCLPSADYAADANAIVQLEAAGFGAVWALQSAHNPFFALTIAAAETNAIQLGVMDDAIFSRSPMITAQIAWDLARQSKGRFILGLGSAPPLHHSDAFDEDFSDPAARMREVVESLQAIWRAFQSDERLRYRGDYYQFRLMAPFFNPGPIAASDIPIWLLADEIASCRLAGEMCHGLHIGPLRRVDQFCEWRSALNEGMDRAGRPRDSIEAAAAVIVISGSSAEHREHALLDAQRHLGRLSTEALHQVAIVAEPDDVVNAVRQRYRGLVDRVCMIWNWRDEALTRAIAAEMQ